MADLPQTLINKELTYGEEKKFTMHGQYHIFLLALNSAGEVVPPVYDRKNERIHLAASFDNLSELEAGGKILLKDLIDFVNTPK